MILTLEKTLKSDTILRTKEIKTSGITHFLVEHSNPEIGSDYDFTRFSVHLRNYHSIGENRLDTRLKVGIASTSYMLPYQRQFVLGGTGTLRGYSLYEFEGNHGFLFNLEYVHSLAKSIYVVPFVDIGQAWHNLEDIKNVSPKVNLGIGFQLGIFRLNFARALERERGYQSRFQMVPHLLILLSRLCICTYTQLTGFVLFSGR